MLCVLLLVVRVAFSCVNTEVLLQSDVALSEKELPVVDIV